MNRVLPIDDHNIPGIASIENLLTFGVAMGILYISIDLYGFGQTTNYVRFATFGLSSIAIALASIVAFTRRGANADLLSVAAILYFICAGARDVLASYAPGVILNLLGAALSLASTKADLHRMLSGFRRWFLVVIIAVLLPAFFGQGFRAGREWFGIFPGRYFGFSNPDGLGFMAGIGALLSIPVLRRPQGYALAAVSALLFVVSAAYTTAIAVGLAITAYFLLTKTKSRQVLQLLTAMLAAVTIGSLPWITTVQGINAFEFLQRQFNLSGREKLWVALLQQARATGSFMTGWGDQVVGNYTRAFAAVGSAHMTILQIFLSQGFLMTVLFIAIATMAAIRILGRIATNPASHQRLAIALVVYWFVTSLVSTQPGTEMGFALILAVAIPRSETETKESSAHSRANRLEQSSP